MSEFTRECKEMTSGIDTAMFPFLVYFVEAAGRIKIGYSHTKTLFLRMGQLEVNCPVMPMLLAVIPCTGKVRAKRDEAALHKQFAKWRHHGEWFEANEELTGVIDEWDSKMRSKR